MRDATVMLQGIPQHQPGSRLEQSGREHVLVDSEGRVTAINDTALALWESCDGEASVREIVDAVCLLFAGPRETLEVDVLATLQGFTDAGLLTWA